MSVMVLSVLFRIVWFCVLVIGVFVSLFINFMIVVIVVLNVWWCVMLFVILVMVLCILWCSVFWFVFSVEVFKVGVWLSLVCLCISFYMWCRKWFVFFILDFCYFNVMFVGEVNIMNRCIVLVLYLLIIFCGLILLFFDLDILIMFECLIWWFVVFIVEMMWFLLLCFILILVGDIYFLLFLLLV